MKTFESFNMETPTKENLFIHLAHPTELEIKFNFIKNIYRKNKNQNRLFYFYKNNCVFNQFKKNKYISIDKDIWDFLMYRTKSSDKEIKNFISDMIIKYLKIDINNYEIDYTSNYANKEINDMFNI